MKISRRLAHPRPEKILSLEILVLTRLIPLLWRVAAGGEVNPGFPSLTFTPVPSLTIDPQTAGNLFVILFVIVTFFFYSFFFFQNGERGYLEGLASRYADLYNTHYRDILEYLDELRAAEWADLSPRITLLAPSSPSRSPSNITIGNNSYTHHLYAPGKYSVSKKHIFFFYTISFFFIIINLRRFERYRSFYRRCKCLNKSIINAVFVLLWFFISLLKVKR